MMKPMNQTYNLVNNYTFNATIRKIKVFLKKDEDTSTDNTEYNLYIDNMPTPYEPNRKTHWPIISILVPGTSIKYYQTLEGNVASILNA